MKFALCLAGFSAAIAGIPAKADAEITRENKRATQAFVAAVKGDRDFTTDFMVQPPTGEELKFVLTLRSCRPGQMIEGLGNRMLVPWSCHVDDHRFRKTTILWMIEGRIKTIEISDYQ